MSGATNWDSMTIDQMWNIVSTADLDSLGKIDTGWKRASELAYLHKSRLESYKEHLVKIWPTEKSDAAKAYVAKLDELIAAVNNSAEVASANQRASSEIRSAMYEARSKIKEIYDRYKKVPKATDSSTGQAYSAQTYAIANEARTVMNTLGNELASAQRTFVQPKPYVPPAPITRKDGYGPSGGDGGSGPSGLVLPLIPVPQVTPTPSQFVATPIGTLTPVPITTGPDLSGLNPTTTLPNPSTLPTGTIGGVPPTTSISGLGTTGLIGGAAGLLNPATGGLGKTMPQGIIGGAPAAAAKTVGGPGGLRANPPGGLIGGGVPPRGGPGVGAIAGRPGLGGVGAIGGRAGTANAHGAFGPMAGGPGATGRAGGMLPTAMGGGRPGQQGEHDGQDFDPDTEWAVAQGVAPVVDSPLADAPVNPGPAIGLDR